MRRLIFGFLFALLATPAWSGTLTVTASGFANTGSSPPANWPSSSVTFPANSSPNGTKIYTVNDADWLLLLTWMASQQLGQIQNVTGNTNVPQTPSAAQILLAWLQIWINGTKNSVQQFATQPAVPPPPITIQ